MTNASTAGGRSPNGRLPGRRVARIVGQTAAFIVGLLLLWWCARQALAPQNRAQLERLAEASFLDIAAIGGLSLVSICFNGLVFWAMIRPVRRLPAVGIVATNALASFLNYLPFKLSIVLRVLVHTKRDRVPFLTVGAWFAVLGVVLLCVYGPLIGVSLWRRSIDWVWVAVGGGTVAALLGSVVLAGRAFRGTRGLDRLEALSRLVLLRIGSGLMSRLLRTSMFEKAHAGADMMASPSAVATCGGFWLADLLVQATRFVIAAGVLGVTLSWQDALLVASCYFIIGVASPAGQIGTREAGTTWLAGVLALAGGEDLAVVMLLASAVESLITLIAAGAALVWLRPDRLIWGRGSPADAAPGPASDQPPTKASEHAPAHAREPSSGQPDDQPVTSPGQSRSR